MKKILFFILSIGIVIAIVAVFIMSQKTPIPQDPEPLPIPSRIPVQQPTLPESNNIDPFTQYELVQQLPYSSSTFDIEYLSIADVFIITIKEDPIEANKQAALSWFIQNGVNPEVLRIQYNIYPYLQ